MRALLIASLVLVTGNARADSGFYFTESVGVSLPRGDLQPYIVQPMKIRLAVGARYRFVAIEPWMSADMQSDREGAFKGFIGGEPAEGLADLSTYGADIKLTAPLYNPPNTSAGLFAYIRGGGSRAEANGALTGYAGWGMGASTGIAIAGRVRALGFLWAPLFFVKRGPFITGSLYMDQGFDWYRLKMPGAPDMTGRVGHVSIGFSLGSAF